VLYVKTLYLLALSLAQTQHLDESLTSTPELLMRHQADVKKILEHVEKERTIPALGVVQILSRNGAASVELVKD
jgi:hypothetical protein